MAPPSRVRVQLGAFAFRDQTFYFKYAVNDDGRVWFVAHAMAKSLMYTDGDLAVRRIVDDQYRRTYDENGSGASPPPRDYSGALFVTAEGAVQLIGESKLPHAAELQTWLLDTVVPRILHARRVGGAPAPGKVDTAGPSSVAEKVGALEAALAKKDALIERILDAKDRQRDEIVNALAETSNRRVDAAIAGKQKQIDRVMNDLNRMYSGFRDTVSQKDDLLRHTIELIENKDAAIERALAALQQKQTMLEKAFALLKTQSELLASSVRETKQKEALLNEAAAANAALLKQLEGRDVDDEAAARPYLYVTRRGRTFTAATGHRSYIDSRRKKMCGRVVVDAKRPCPRTDWNEAVALARDDDNGAAVKRKHKRLTFKSEEAAGQFESELKSRFAEADSRR